MIIQDSLVFDDVLLVPKYSEIESRSKVDLSVSFKKDFFSWTYKHPAIPANMASIFEYEMARFVFQSGGLGFIHRFMKPEQQLDILSNLEKEFGKTIYKHIGVSVGVKKEDYAIVDMFVKNRVEIICVDIAHGDSKLCKDMVSYITKQYPIIFLIAGNVATGSAAERLWRAGADAVKVGIGNGSICSTRLQAASGVGQLSALMEVSEMRKSLQTEDIDWNLPLDKNLKYQIKKPQIMRQLMIISDGGISKPGDACKALLFADMFMAGNVFSGTDECPGDIVEQNGKKYKRYDGSSTHSGLRVEGVKALTLYKGLVEKVFNSFFDGLQSCASYQGVSNLNDLKKDFTLVKITNSGLRETNIHDVFEIKE